MSFTFESGPIRWVNTSDSVTPGWIPVGVVYSGEEIDVAGLNPWSKMGGAETGWRSLHRWIIVAHPAYPAQRHGAEVYQLDSDVGRIVTFAATELSNGVWGFFLPAGL